MNLISAPINGKALKLTRQPISVISPAPRDVWNDLMRSDPEALPYQMPAWLDAMCAADGYEDASRLYNLAGDQQLIMPMVRRRGLLSALKIESSLPNGWGMGGLIARKPIRPEEIALVFADLSSRSSLRTSIRPNPRAGATWAAAQPHRVIAIPRFAHVLDLEGGFDMVWTKRFNSVTRGKIRKAERSGLVVEYDTSGKLVPVFYDLFLRSIDRWAEQQHEPRVLARWRNQRRDSQHKLQVIAQMMGGACHIWVASHKGQPIAAMLVLQDANVNDSRAVMDKELCAPVYANDLLQKLAIEEACRAGCRYYHMGESGRSTGLNHYKSRFGAYGCSYSEYRLERLPITKADTFLRGFVKKLIGFKDV